MSWAVVLIAFAGRMDATRASAKVFPNARNNPVAVSALKRSIFEWREQNVFGFPSPRSYITILTYDGSLEGRLAQTLRIVIQPKEERPTIAHEKGAANEIRGAVC